MGIAQNGRSIQRLVYVDENLVEHIILTAYLGDQLVWDGHISQVIQVPRASMSLAGRVPVISGSSQIEAPTATFYLQGQVPVVGASVAVAPPQAALSLQAFAPDMYADSLVVAPAAAVSFQAFAPTVRVVFGVTPPTATMSFEGYAPDLHADAQVNPPAAQAVYFQGYAPQVGSFAIVNPPKATVSFTAFAPTVSSTAQVAPPQAALSLQAFAPTLTRSGSVAPPTAAVSFQGFAPTVTGGTLARQRMDKSGNTNLGTGTGSPKQVTGWTSDATYPATITSDELVIAGAGPVTITLQWNLTGGSQGSGKFVQLYRNTSTLLDEVNPGTATNSTTSRPLTWSGTVADGDRIRMSIKDLNGAGQCTVNASGTYIDVNP